MERQRKKRPPVQNSPLSRWRLRPLLLCYWRELAVGDLAYLQEVERTAVALEHARNLPVPDISLHDIHLMQEVMLRAEALMLDYVKRLRESLSHKVS